jgi:hypothetical protein
MENGGNAKINAIFEAKLAQSGRTKLTNLADGPTRERYVRDKYERRKFYDPAGFAMETGSAATLASHNMSDGGNIVSQSRPGAPSDIARRRVASRQAQMKPHKSNVVATKVPSARVAQAPVSAPVEFDLLDFGSEIITSPGQTSSVANGGDLFSSQPAIAPTGAATQTNHLSRVTQKSAISPPPKTVPSTATSTSFAQELLNNPAPATKPTTSNDDIMALFGPSKQQQKQQPVGFGMQAMDQMRPSSSVNNNSMMVNGIVSQQQNQTQQANMMAFNNQQNMMSQQQQMMMMMQNNNMMANGNQMVPNQMMQQQMMMQKQMMMQQQMANRHQPNNSSLMSNTGMYNSATNGVNNSFRVAATNGNNVGSAIQGIQNLNMGNAIARQTSGDGGFGTPMGGGSQQQSMKNDAFSSLGGMNAFR